MQISEDDTGSLVLKIHGGLEILSEEDEAALLQRLLDRAGGLQNLWTEAACNPADPKALDEWICPDCARPVLACFAEPCKARTDFNHAPQTR